jgi:hypothetical protein
LKGKFLMVFAVAFGVSILSLPLFAHHGYAAYDTERKVGLKGTVIQWLWANPHCMLQFDVADDSGQVAHWVAETENPTAMTNLGWTKQSLKPGDQVTVSVLPVKNGKPIGRIREIVFSNGEKLSGPHSALDVSDVGVSKQADHPKQ